MRRTVLAVVAACMAMMTDPAMARVEYPELTGYVVDVSDVIPADREAELETELRDFERRTRHQMVVVTVPDLKGMSKVDYAVGIGRHWGIGRKGVDDGIVLLQSSGDGRPGSGRIWIEPGHGLTDVLTSAEATRIVSDVMAPILRQERPRSDTVPEAILEGARATMRIASTSPEERALAERRAQAKAETDRRRSMATLWDFMLTAAGLVAIGGAGYGIWLLATRKERARRRAEEAEIRRLAAEQREIDEKNARREAELAAAERRRLEAETIALREAMLAAMSPGERAAFLEEERMAEAQRRRIADEERARQERIAEERRRVERERESARREARRLRDEQDARDAAIADAMRRDDDDDRSDRSEPRVSGGGGTFGGAGGGLDY